MNGLSRRKARKLGDMRIGAGGGALGVLAGALSAYACFSVAPAAYAQEADNAGLEDIVVTARRRETRLQETPIAVSSFSGETISELPAADISQVMAFTPNVTFDTTAPISGASNAAGITIRGIGQTDFALTTEAGVGTYVDGVYMSRSLGGVLDVLDIERLEVLRGPQGTLFGRNTIGGAINITSERPSDEYGGQVGVSIGETNRFYLRGSVDLPLADNLAVRVSASSKDRDGYVRSRTDPSFDLGNENRQALRAVLAWEPASNVDVNWSVDATRIREQNAASILRGTTGTPANGPVVFVYNAFEATTPDTVYSDANFVTGDLSSTYANGPNGTEIDGWGTAVTLSWRALANLELKSISAYRHTEGSFNRDADGSPIDITHTSNSGYEHEQISQELQLIGSAFSDRLSYVAGVYYFQEEGHDPLIVDFPSSFAVLHQDRSDIDNQSYAVFGEATLGLTERLSLTAGLRWTRDEKNFDTHQYLITGTASPIVFGAPAGTIVFLVPPNSSVSDSYEDVSPRVTLQYDWTDNVMTYLTFSEGFKSGGFNLRYVSPRPAVSSFDPEHVSTYEIGAKIEGFDRSLRLNMAAFYTEYSDVQMTLFESLGAPVTLNGGDAEIRGAEAELMWAPSGSFLLSGSIGYIDAEYVSLSPLAILASTPEQVISSSSRLPNVPEWQASLSAEYAFHFEGDASLKLRADWTYSSDYYNDAQNSMFLYQDAYDILSLAMTYTSPDGNWDVRVFVENVGDERYIISGDSNYGIGFHEGTFNRPREVGATLTLRF